jgi:lysophospholipase L1-like esterase
VASKNLKLYEQWGDSFWGQWGQVVKEIVVYNQPGENPPFHLKPNSHVKLIESPIDINGKGFRGREIAGDKGANYRIVALGESTTFGFTVTAADRPWSERLEQLIHDRLKLPRPVEVINAGVPAFDLNNNVARLPVDILALKPDMIISYHGLNGFHWIDPSLPSMFGRPPGYRRRPLGLLAEAEFKFRLMRFNRERAAEALVKSPPPGDPMQSEYAQEYRQLIQIARTNQIRLVLANYSMAVNHTSDPKVKQFYSLTFPGIDRVIAANESHTAIVEQLGREHPEISVVDTHPNLDGRHEEYIDLVHFSEEGEAQMAENVFAGIKPLLEAELSPAPAPRN